MQVSIAHGDQNREERKLKLVHGGDGNQDGCGPGTVRRQTDGVAANAQWCGNNVKPESRYVV